MFQDFFSILGVSPPSKNCLLFLHAFCFYTAFSIGAFFVYLFAPSWLFSQPLFQLRLLGHTLLRFPITLLVFNGVEMVFLSASLVLWGHSDTKVRSKTMSLN